MVQTKAKGITTELLCQAYFSSLGYNVSVPIGEDCRYDMIIDLKGHLLRVQVKSCTETKNGLSFSTKSITTSSKENVIHTYSKEEIDFIATYFDNQCYLIPVEECEGHRERSLSFRSEKTNAISPLFIEDYQAEKIIERVLHGDSFERNDDHFMVYQYDLQGNFISGFYSYAEAGESLGKTSSHISQCARGLRKTAYGYVWSLTPKE